jgi:hypothetical protein
VTGATIQCLSHSANPAIEIWSWSSESNTRRRGTSSLHCHCARPAKLLELARSLELRSGAYRAPALPVELYQRSWRGDSNADHGLTRPELFPLSYTATPAQNFFTTIWRRWGELHSRLSALQADALLSWLHRLVTYLLTWSGRRDSNPRSRRRQRRVLATRRLPPGASSES